jgi:hypothetical protein
MNDLVETPKNDAADRFKAMAASIEHNPIATFGGAVVIMPPANGGEPIELLILDLKADPAQFWSTIRTRIDIKLAELDEARRNTTAFGGRR